MVLEKGEIKICKDYFRKMDVCLIKAKLYGPIPIQIFSRIKPLNDKNQNFVIQQINSVLW